MENKNTEVSSTMTTTKLTNETDPGQEESTEHHLLVLKVVCLCLISIVGFIGNVTIFTTLLRRKRKPSEYCILNLAITDLMVCLIGIPLDIYEQFHEDGWHYGGFLCKIIYPIQTLFILISIMTLTTMSVERYRVIMTPLKQRPRKIILLAIIGFLWVLGIIVIAPYANILTYTAEGFCEEEWPEESHGNYYTVALFIIDYCIPLTIITYCYSTAGYKLYKNNKHFNREENNRFSCQGQHLALKSRYKRNKKTIKRFSFAVVIFVICTLPGDAYWMWLSFGNGSEFKYGSHLQTFTNILLYANSAINPYILGACQMACFRNLNACGRVMRRTSRKSFRTRFSYSWRRLTSKKESSSSSAPDPDRETRV